MSAIDRRGERGSILILVIISVLIVSMAVAAMVTTAVEQGRSVTHDLDHAEAMALAEGVTEAAQRRMLTQVANFLPVELEGIVTLGGQDYPYATVAVGDSLTREDTDGVTMVIQPYEITAAVEVDRARVEVSRVVELTMTPIFQYMLFYSDDLEILPGPNMTLGGRVHSNGSIYVGAGKTLAVDTEYFRATGHIYRERKNDGSTSKGTVNIKVTGEDSYVNMTPSMDSDADDWISLALDNWSGTVQDGAHGVKHVSAPSIGTIKAFDENGDKGYYHDNASLVIVDDEAFDGDGDPVALPEGVLTEITMWDGREQTVVTLTEIDVEALNDSGQFPPNGLLYAYRTDATVDQPNGIRLTNGAEVHAPMTVVTEDPIYIQGDFNTVDKKGVAVFADAVNLLSNDWDDTKGSSGLPTASDTWYNVLMVTGNTPTPDGGGTYSGGFENLPRFHESWSGKTASIRGSFIKIFESEIAVSPWRYGGNVYKAPARDWLFDPDLNDIDNMPPFTPNAVYYRRVTWDDNVPLPFDIAPSDTAMLEE